MASNPFPVPQHFKLIMGTISPAPDPTVHDILFFSGELEKKPFSFALTEEATQGYIENGKLPFGIALQAMRAGYRVRFHNWGLRQHLFYSESTNSIRLDDGLTVGRWEWDHNDIMQDRWWVADINLIGQADEDEEGA